MQSSVYIVDSTRVWVTSYLEGRFHFYRIWSRQEFGIVSGPYSIKVETSFKITCHLDSGRISLLMY